MQTLKKIYCDLDLTFNRQPVSGDISVVYDNRSVINSVRNLLLTNYYERPWQPGLGSNLTALLFEPVNAASKTIMARMIEDVINNFEPRIKLNYVKVTSSPQEDGYNVNMSFYISNNSTATEINLFLERIR